MLVIPPNLSPKWFDEKPNYVTGYAKLNYFIESTFANKTSDQVVLYNIAIISNL